MRRWIASTALLAAAAGLGLLAPAGAQAAPYCGITWGSQTKSSTGTNPSPWWPITDVRSGKHRCYDRLVIDFDGRASAYRVRYVSTVREPGSGDPVPLRGGADLEIVAKSVTYDIDTGAPTYDPANPRELVRVTGRPTFRQVALGGSFEGQTTFGLGVRTRLPFRVTRLSDPGRLVIDVAHRW